MKVAVPCDAERRPIAGLGLFHEKAGIIEDAAGNRLAFSGSLNETEQGWRLHWDSFHVFTSWGGTAGHVQAEEQSFQQLWADKASMARVVDVPTAVREALLEFLPKDDIPGRLKKQAARATDPSQAPPLLRPAPRQHRALVPWQPGVPDTA